MALSQPQPTPLWRHRIPRKPSPTARLGDVSVVALDVETTGRAAALGHRITEIALVGRDTDRFQAFVDHTGETALPFQQIYREVLDRLHNRVIVGHNITFDLEFLAKEIERIPHTRQPQLYFIDTLALAKQLLADTGPWTLFAVASRLALAPEGPLHTAPVDALLALEVFETLAQQLESPTLKDLNLRRLLWRGELP